MEKRFVMVSGTREFDGIIRGTAAESLETIQPGPHVRSRIFLRADNVPEFYVSLSDPIPEETALLVMPDGRAVFIPAARIEDAGLDKELPPAGVPFFSTFLPISDTPGERLTLTKPIPLHKSMREKLRPATHVT